MQRLGFRTSLDFSMLGSFVLPLVRALFMLARLGFSMLAASVFATSLLAASLLAARVLRFLRLLRLLRPMTASFCGN